MSDVFVSYSRSDVAFARVLNRELEKEGLETWIDWQDIPPSTDWMKEVYQAIEVADSFIFVISEKSVGSEVCSRELEHASKNNKRLIPVVIDEIAPQDVPPSVAALNWIFFTDKEVYGAAFKDLFVAIRMDAQWIKAHTWYQTRALEWDRKDQSRGYLLRGRELEKAETWLKGAVGKDPQPTSLQSQYVLASRKDAGRRQTRILAAALLGVAVTVALGITAWSQRNQAVEVEYERATAEALAVAEAYQRATAEDEARQEADLRATAQVQAEEQRAEAEAQRNSATSRGLAAVAQMQLQPDSLDLALLLAVEASGIIDNPEARGSLLAGLTYRPHLQRILHNEASESIGYSDGVAFSPDGSLAASGNDSHNITLWDTSTGQRVGEPLVGHEVIIMSLAFSPDGSSLASGDIDGTVILWNVEELESEGEPLPGYNAVVRALDFSPDGRSVAVGGDRGVVLRDVRTGEVIDYIPDPGGYIWDLAFSPDGSLLAYSVSRGLSTPGMVAIWDLVDQEQVFAVSTHISGAFAVDFSPDGRTLASGGDGRHIFDEGEVKFWDVETGELLTPSLIELPGHVRSVNYLPSGEGVLFNLFDSFRLWKPGTDTDFAQSFLGRAKDMALSPIGDLFGTAGPDATVYLWDLIDRQSNIQHPFPGSIGTRAVVYHPGGDLMASAGCMVSDIEGGVCEMGGITLWETDSQRTAGEPLSGHNGAATAVAYNADGSLLASGGEDGSITVWRVPEGKVVRQVPGIHDGEISTLVFSPNGTSLASSGVDGNVYLINAQTGERLFEALDVLTGGVLGLAFDPSGEILAVSGNAGVVLLDAASGVELGRALEDHLVNAVAFSPLGDLLVVGDQFGWIHFWEDPRGGNAPASLEAYSEGITALAISPQGEMAVVATEDGMVLLWDIHSQRQIGEAALAAGLSVSSLVFSLDGESFASVDPEGIVLWEVSLTSWQEHACRIANRNLTQLEWATYLAEEPYHKTCPQIP
jgi:WD40 repeat protein